MTEAPYSPFARAKALRNISLNLEPDAAREVMEAAAQLEKLESQVRKYPGHAHLRLATLLDRADREGGIDFVTPPSPPLAPIIDAAWTAGYAIGVHGSLHRDLDLIAMPWTEGAGSPEDLLACLWSIAGLKVVGELVQKPHGRVAATLRLDGDRAYKPVDLSIVARTEVQS